jgi:hypothetical protein
MLAPSKVVELWRGTPSPSVVAQNEGISTVAFRAALMAYLAIVKNESVNKVIGIGIIPMLVLSAKMVLNETPKKVGSSTQGQVLFTAITAIDTAVAYACLSNATYANTAIKFYIGWRLFNGLSYFFAPTKVAESWGIADAEDIVTLCTKAMGASTVAISVLMAALVQGVDPIKAYGLSWIPIVLSISSYLFITKEVEKVGMNAAPYYFYLVLGAVTFGTLAL